MKPPEELQFIANARMVQKATAARMEGRLCVITGATSGVGYHTAQRLAQGGASLVLVCRDREKAVRVRQELTGQYRVDIDIVQADFARLAEVREAAGIILANHPRIDVLINNAGLHTTRRTLSENGIETVFCVNHLASFLFTRLLLDRLVESAPARILQVNSQGHRFGGLDLNDINWEKRRYRGLQGRGIQDRAASDGLGAGRQACGQRCNDQRHAPWRGQDQHRHEQWLAVPVVPALPALVVSEGSRDFRGCHLLPGRGA